MTNKLIIISALVLFTFGYAVYHALRLDGKLASKQDYFSSNSVLKILPNVVIPSFFSKDTFDLEAIADNGNLIVVHFWATWCGPCEQEFPEIVELTERLKNKENIKFLFVTVNDKEKDVKKFLSKYKLDNISNYEILRDDKFIHQKNFGTYKLPETYIFGSDKKLIRKFSGAQKWTDQGFVNMLSNL